MPHRSPNAHESPSRRRRAAAVLLGAAALGLAACGSSGSKQATATSTASTSTTTSAPSSSAAPSTTAAAQPVPAGFRPLSVTFVSASTGFVLGTAPCAHEPCTYLARTDDGGRHWGSVGQVPAPTATSGSTTPTAGTVGRVRFADAHNGWAFGDALWATHDGGATWSQVSVRPVLDLGAAQGRVTAVVSGCAAAAGCPTVGITSSPVSSDAFTGAGGAISLGSNADVALALHGTAVALVAGGQVFTGTSAHGLTPTAAPCPSGTSAGSVALTDSTHLFALCAGGAAMGSADKLVRRSTDGGATWSDLPSAPRGGQPTGLTVSPDATTVLVGAASGATFVYREREGAWTTAFDDTAHGGVSLVDLGFTTDAQAVAVLRGVAVVMSRDGGATWSTVGP